MSAAGSAEVFKPQKIFLSYAHMVDGNDDETALLVEAIKSRLEEAGHQAWIDKEQLNPGADWRQGITQGILESDRILSFLSPRSIRDPGVCLDEIGIAMGVRHGAIATILADRRVENAAPASVTHIQYLDLSDWKAVMAESEIAWSEWLTGKTQLILDIVDRHTGFAGEIEKLARQLNPSPTGSKVGALLARGFVGRQWVMQAIEDWRLNKLDQQLFWLKAGPGMGKSSIAAHLAHFARTQTVAAHFCEYNIPESRNAAKFVHNLAFMLAARLSDYRRLLTYQLELLDKPLSQFNADELLRRLVLEPLRNKIDGGQRDDRLLVVVDALDEADQELPALLARYMHEVPRWLGFVVTSRPETESLLGQFKPMELRMDDARNQEDLRAYLDEWQRQQPAAALSPATRQALIHASDGNILYLVYARAGARDGLFDLTQPQNFPRGMVGIYREWLTRQFGSDPESNPRWSEQSYPLLELVCASPLPLPISQAERILDWDERDLVKAMRPLGSLLEVQDETLRLCHRSLSDWLQDKRDSKTNPFWVSTKKSSVKLAQALLKQLPAALNDDQPSYVHLTLPGLLQTIAVGHRSELWSTDWDAAMCSLDQLANYLPDHPCESSMGNELILKRFLFAERRRCLGASSPETLRAMSFLAERLSRGGYSERLEGLPLRGELLELSTAVLGERHPDTLRAMGGLALACSESGVSEDARLLQKKVLALSTEVMGDRHPDTLNAMANLAFTLGELGEWRAARELQEKVLVLSIEVLGERHPGTLVFMNNLACTLNDFDDHGAARELHEKVLALSTEILGERHPDTLSVMSNLATYLSDRGAARALQEKVLALTTEVLGERHPNTLIAMSNLADTLSDLGALEAARALQERRLSLLTELLGWSAPDTLKARAKLDALLSQQRDWPAQKAQREDQLEMLTKFLGDRHPATLTQMANLALTLGLLGDGGAARALQEKVLALRTELLGERHPDTLHALNNLALLLASQGDMEAAQIAHAKVREMSAK